MKESSQTSNIRGYFGIGIYQPKFEENVGTLWRSAYQLGADFIFIIGKKYKKQCSDTPKAFRHIPLFQFETWEDFTRTNIYDCKLVCIEFNNKSVPLRRFRHPERACYLLGAEDNGLPTKIEKYNECVEIPSVRIESYNVAMSGTIVMYDRLIKNIK